ncbi:NAD(P)H-dependent glycerol-3-phosphate dehydrogenase [soil metagenome]
MTDAFGKVGVLGTGSWGTALACLARESAPEVILCGRNSTTVEEINSTRQNSAYLPGVTLAENIRATTEVADLRDADLVLVVVPSKAVRAAAGSLSAARLSPSAVLVSCAKGIELSSGARMTEILHEVLPANPVAVLSGPNHAEEIAAGQAAAAVIGCHDEALAIRLQAFFMLPWFRTYTSTDLPGIEWAGAVKNVFAIAAGIADGLGLGDNTKAALVTRGLAEMVRIGVAHGGRRETFQGLSGVGDLVATCYSDHSRNNRLGKMLGKGVPLPEAVASMKMVAEGVPNTESIYRSARRAGVRTPLIDAVFAILYEQKHPVEALQELLSRDPRPEDEEV